MKITRMKKKDFADVPYRGSFDSDVPLFNSLVIIPTGKMHPSGYMLLEFVAVDRNDEPICRLSRGCSDVLHLDGICGYGEKYTGDTRPRIGWKIDCLPCGYLRLFAEQPDTLKAGHALSDFSVYYAGKVRT